MTNEEKFRQVFKCSFNCIGNATSAFACKCQKEWLNAKYIEKSGDYISKEEAIAIIPKVIGGRNDFADAIRDSVEAVINACESIDQESYYKDLAQSYEKTINKLTKAIEECEDAVSRQAVKDGMIKYGFHASDMTVTEFVEDLPPVIPKREQGEWIFEEVGVRTQVLKCSKCGTIIQRGENFTQEEFRNYINDILREKCITLDNFCHNCGAEMEGGINDNN